jgi:hypothetical protein
MTSSLTAKGSTRKWREKHRKPVLVRDHYTCQWCGEPADTVGHIVARRHGGGDELTNLAAQCRECQRKERPLPSVGLRARLHNPDAVSAYSEGTSRVGQPVHNAPGQPVAVYGRPRASSVQRVTQGQRGQAGETVAGQRRRSTFFRNGGS